MQRSSTRCVGIAGHLCVQHEYQHIAAISAPTPNHTDPPGSCTRTLSHCPIPVALQRQYVRYALYGGSGLGIFVVTTNDINRTVEANDEPMRQDQMEDLSDTIAARTAKAKWRW